MASRDADFTQAEKIELAKLSGYRCSHPDCAIPTVGPGKEPGDKAVTIGEAAHIRAASKEGPRHEEGMDPAARKSAIANGIWLCRQHAALIDKNAGSGYTAEQLHQWREKREGQARSDLEFTSKVNPKGVHPLGTPQGGAGFGAFNSTNITFENNLSEDNDGAGFAVSNVEGAVFRENQAKRNRGPGYQVGPVSPRSDEGDKE